MAMLMPYMVLAQFSLKGKVTESDGKTPLPGASVHLGTRSTFSNASGDYTFDRISAGEYLLQVRFVGFEKYSTKQSIQKNSVKNIALERASFIADAVIVKATRANENTATAYSNLKKDDIEKYNTGQDLPYMLNQTPSVVVSSDAGTGIGYTGIRVRGSDPSRVNVTVNGIPLNNAESQGSFFVNMPDFASSVDNIQIQRGVGTSTNGVGAFGASINIQTTVRRDTAYAELNNSYGSFKSLKNTLNVGTGLINNHFTFDARLSNIRSDGYIDRAFSRLKSFFVTGAYYGKKDLIRFNVFSGKEKTYQAWNGVPEDLMETNRTHNDFTYENQTDNYQQDHYQAFYTHTFSEKLLLNTALHYTYGRGYYEEFREADSLKNYGLTPPVVNGTAIEVSNLVRQRWLRNHFYGMTYSLNYKPESNLEFILGGAYNEYRGQHFGDVIWAEVPYILPSTGYTSLGHRYYDNDAVKTDFNSYLRANYRTGDFNIYADLQYRRVGYSFLGYDRNLNNVQQKAILNFFNPKVGVTYTLDPHSHVYASFAVGQKEPNRDDFTESTPDSRPRAEKLNDLEFGYRLQKERLSAGINFYGMFYKDQLVSTGRINDVGAAVRQNVDKSYRMGVELDANWQIIDQLRWGATATFSRNKIKDFTEYLSEGNAQTAINYHDTDILLSPSVIASSEISYTPFKHAEIAFLSKYVGKQYIDNTTNRSSGFDSPDNRDRTLKAFLVNDLRLRYSTKAGSIKRIGIALQVNNVFNELYSNNAWVYREIGGGVLYSYNGFFPQATRNYMATLSLNF